MPAVPAALVFLLLASRMAFGTAEQRLLPPVLGRVLPGRRTPWVAIAVTTVVAMALTLVGDLGALANIVVLLLLLVFLSTNVAVLVLRRDRVEQPHFTAPVVLPVLAIGSCLLLLYTQEARTWLFAGVMLLVGVALYALGQAPVARRPGGPAVVNAAGVTSG